MTPDSRRRPELDGLRGLAILLVVVAHAWNGVYPTSRQLIDGMPKEAGGGFVGVQLFFVLSGFLITGLLLGEHERSGRIRLGSFYMRRVRRLLPALLLVAGVYLIFSLIVRDASGDREAIYGVVRSVFYIEDLPVDSILPSDGYLTHTWSLAVEEQFYLAWPLVLIVALRWGGRRAATTLVVASIILVTVVRLLFSHYGLTVYERLHWDALLVGCLLALRPMKAPAWVGWVALIPMAVLSAFLAGGANEPYLYTVTAFAGGAMIVTASEMKWLRARWLIFFGTISYGLYLWHVLLMRYGFHPLPTVLVSIGLATASFYWFERRFLRHSKVQAARVLVSSTAR